MGRYGAHRFHRKRLEMMMLEKQREKSQEKKEEKALIAEKKDQSDSENELAQQVRYDPSPVLISPSLGQWKVPPSIGPLACRTRRERGIINSSVLISDPSCTTREESGGIESKKREKS